MITLSQMFYMFLRSTVHRQSRIIKTNDFCLGFRFVLIENIDMNLFLGRKVFVVRIEGPVGMIEREVFVLPPVDISAAIRCL